MTAVFDPEAADKLVKICGMFGSAHDGERAAAAAKAHSLVRSLGLTWPDVIALPDGPPLAPEPASWRDVLLFCLDRLDQLNPREREFLRSLKSWRGHPTEKQIRWLVDIANRLDDGGHR